LRTEVWKLKSNSSSVLRAGEAGGHDAQLAAGGLARGDLGLEQRLDEALVAPLFLAGAVGELGQRSGGGGCLELSEQVGEFGLATHAGIRAS
jgi:hypothetical protein